jgi:ADP-dependent NAD(P)H-hydrate dehydratase
MSTGHSVPQAIAEIPYLATRPPGMHKGQAGKVAIIAGSRGMSGAAVLCGLGALRGGAGLVRVCTAETVQPIVATSEPCLMTTALPENEEHQIDGRRALNAFDLTWPDVLAVGPGLGQSAGVAAFVRLLLESLKTPLVIDADALNNIAHSQAEWWTGRQGQPTIITPHLGEMARLRKGAGLPELAGEDDDTRLRIAHEYACLSGAVVVLKGFRTVVCTADRAYFNASGNPGMATGGMGDVLTGLIAALLGQGLHAGQDIGAFEAACLGVYVHGAAAEIVARQIGAFGYLAREVADAIPAALARASRGPMGFK